MRSTAASRASGMGGATAATSRGGSTATLIPEPWAMHTHQGGGETGAVHLDNGDVRPCRATDHCPLDLLAIRKADGDRGLVLDHMGGGEDQPVRVIDHTRANTGGRSLASLDLNDGRKNHGGSVCHRLLTGDRLIRLCLALVIRAGDCRPFGGYFRLVVEGGDQVCRRGRPDHEE